MKRIEYTKLLLELHIINCYSFSELCRRIGLKPVGSNLKTVLNKLNLFNIDYSHFTGKGWNTKVHKKFGSGGTNVKTLDEFFNINSTSNSSKVRERLIKNGFKENVCEICGLSEWQGKAITILLHHINGIPTDNRLCNLQMLCPNCHSQTDTYCKRKSIR